MEGSRDALVVLLSYITLCEPAEADIGMLECFCSYRPMIKIARRTLDVDDYLSMENLRWEPSWSC